MAEATIPVEQLTCPVCLDLLNVPVTIPCGHSYCMSCINDCWDQTRVYSCPHCRRVFTPRPDLGKNIILTEMIETLKQNQLHAADPTHSYAGHGDVCDMCIGRKHPAVKSCLMCLKSYCHAHFEHHKMIYSGKAHEVIDATRLQKNICRQHNKQLDVLCRTDQQLMCSLCTRDEHKNHDTVPAVAESTEKRKQLKISQRNFQNYIRIKKVHLQQLRDNVKSHKWSAQTESLAERRAEQLEKEIDHLNGRDAELNELLNTHDHIQFLQRFQSFSGPDIPVETSELTSIFSVDDFGKPLKGLELKSKTVPRPRPSSLVFQPSVCTPAISKPQVWPPTPPKPRPRPSSIALYTGASTLPKSWAKSKTPLEPQSRPNIESVFHRNSFTASKPTFGTVTGESESKRRPIILPPESDSRTSTATESSHRTSTAPESRFRTSKAPVSPLRTSIAPKFGTVTSRTSIIPESSRRPMMPPKLEPTTYTVPETQLRTSTAPHSQLRTSTAPESQLMISIAPKFGTVTSRTSVTPESSRWPMMPPKLEPTTYTIPETQLRTSTAPESQLRTSTAPESQLRTSTAPETQLRTSTAPESQLRTSIAPKFGTVTSRTDVAPTTPKSCPRTSTAPESFLRTSIAPKFGIVISRTRIPPEISRRPMMPAKPETTTSTVPESQLRTSTAPKFGTVTSRTSIPPQSRHRPMIAPKPEPTTTTAAESHHNHDLVKELKSKLIANKLYVP
ncbi:E3 ubiquitin/ISG15 ligase TRIM25 [Triplophysa tibetana]|uniref:E3 ubiquitin/ISG15 ligase TRIM25 n=1 Tax=Triplophysa tibetana TaxID=1572043 RepID=A0A5A9N7U6_9TELE|nr:E3 ubiquitin/ISG15 ligase TRIM25 [Triplophysa tibetana]